MPPDAPDTIDPNAPAGAPGVPPVAPGAGTPPAGVVPPGTPGEQPKRPTTGDLGGDSGEILKERLAKEREKGARDAKMALLAELGIEDPAKFKQDYGATKAQLDKYKQAEEERKRAEMTEVDRYKADLEKANAKIAEYDEKWKNHELDQAASAADENMGRVVSKLVRPGLVKFILHSELTDHFKTLTSDEIEAFGEKELTSFVQGLIRDNPDYAQPKSAPVPTNGGNAQPPKPGERKPAGVSPTTTTQGAPKATDTTRPGSAGSKTFRPGEKNTASAAEVRAALKERGIKTNLTIGSGQPSR